MTIHLQREIEKLRKMILAEGTIVEEAIHKSIYAYSNRDERVAREVIGGDRLIDSHEVDVEEECLKILALYQPVAVDLRFIVAVLKMNVDLERMGDIALSIARRAVYLVKHDPVDLPPEIDKMAETVKDMVKKSLDALVNHDPVLAMEVCREDDIVDDMKRDVAKIIRKRMAAEPQNLTTLLKILDIPRHLERLADLATNIAEDVIYLVRGDIIRHSRTEKKEWEEE